MRATRAFHRAPSAAAAIVIAIALALGGSVGSASAAKPGSPPGQGGGGDGGDGGGGGATSVPIPKAMAAAGDSISVATNHSLSCALFGGCASASWTTGSSTTVDSHYLRLRDLNKRITVRNAAVSGATMADLNRQVGAILAGGYRPGYVTVLIGANDLCGTSLTPTETFRSQFSTALNTLYATSPGTSVFVGSIPDLTRLYAVLESNPDARATWDRFDICPLVLTPGIDQTPVIERHAEFNRILEDVCASMNTAALPNRCRFDGYAIANTDFLASDISTVDYFHPSIAGQKKLSAIAWAASFWPTR